MLQRSMADERGERLLRPAVVKPSPIAQKGKSIEYKISSSCKVFEAGFVWQPRPMETLVLLVYLKCGNLKWLMQPNTWK